MRVPFQQVDAFTREPYRGNPLAVILDGRGLSDAQMLRIANWTNLSETTFLLPPDDPAADYRVRIFTGIGELPFAGHPTLGSCHAWLHAGGRPKGEDVVQQCQAGLIRIRRGEAGRLAFAAPPLSRSGPLASAELQAACDALSLSPDDVLHAAWCDNGPGWIGLMLRDAQAVLSVKPPASGRLKLGLIGAHRRMLAGVLQAGTDDAVAGSTAPRNAGPDSADFEVRAFFPRDGGMFEDPVTGSLNAAFASWLIPAGLAPPRYQVRQGTCLGRQGDVFVQAQASDDSSGTNYWIGGQVQLCIEGQIEL